MAREVQTPTNLSDLASMQDRVEEVVEKARSATVALQVGMGTGSGVIVSPDGIVLTAAHVIGKPGRRVTVNLPDGREAVGRTLGVLVGVRDAGMVKLIGDGPWPYVDMAQAPSEAGEWVVALGHPGGFDQDRDTVVRLGRVIRVRQNKSLQTDCTLIGGDSGGPLFNLAGELIGIHSRIGSQMRSNYHVPMSVYREHWDELLRGRTLADQSTNRGRPIIGVVYNQTEDGCLVTGVLRGSGAEQGGVLIGDLIVEVDGESAANPGTLGEVITETDPGQMVRLTILRDQEEIKLQVRVGRGVSR
jgi:serine protease Do